MGWLNGGGKLVMFFPFDCVRSQMNPRNIMTLQTSSNELRSCDKVELYVGKRY